jgi:adenylate cyclase
VALHRAKSRTAAILAPAVAVWTYLFVVSEVATLGRLDEILLGQTAYSFARQVSAKFSDLKFRARGERKPVNPVVIVAIDEEAISSYGRWPWSRDLMGYLVSRIREAGARVIALDAVFPEPDDRVPQALKEVLQARGLGQLLSSCRECDLDATFETSLRLSRRQVVLGWGSEFLCQPRYASSGEEHCSDAALREQQVPVGFERFAILEHTSPRASLERRSPFPAALGPVVNLQRFNQQVDHSGYFFYEPEPDGIVRKAFLISTVQGKHHPALALAAVQAGARDQLALELDSRGLVRSLKFRETGVALGVSPVGALSINFRGGAEKFPYLSAAAIMGESDSEPVRGLASNEASPLSILKDAYVLIGATAVGMRDIRQTPFDMNYPGVEVHATIIDNLLARDWLHPSATGMGFWVLALLMTLGIFLYGEAFRRLEVVPAMALALGVLSLGVWGDYTLFTKLNQDWNTGFFYFELVTCTGLVIVAKYWQEERTKKFVQGAFARYVSPAVVAEIVRNPEKLKAGGVRREISVLFCDIRGFSSLAEKMDAPALSAFLQDYLTIVTDVVIEYGGTVDKYIGDAIMAFWNAPLDQPDHARRAVEAATAMLQALEDHRWRLKRDHGVSVEMGIGVNTGIASVGNMGSHRSFNYTAIGDQVNLASRLEGLTKHYGVGAVASRETLNSLGSQGVLALLPPHRVLDVVKVKGRQAPVEVVELLSRRLSPTGLKLYEHARKHYVARDWEHAAEFFEKADAELQGDGPSRVMQKRCRALAAGELKLDPESWDGSWIMEEK